MTAGFYLDEMFRFEGKRYGIVKSVDDKKFNMFVRETIYSDETIKWESLNETMENAVKYF